MHSEWNFREGERLQIQSADTAGRRIGEDRLVGAGIELADSAVCDARYGAEGDVSMKGGCDVCFRPIADISVSCDHDLMKGEKFLRAGLAGLVCVVTGAVASILHYKADASQFIVLATHFLPAIGLAYSFWQRVAARLIAGIALSGVSLLTAFLVAVGVFHDGP